MDKDKLIDISEARNHKRGGHAMTLAIQQDVRDDVSTYYERLAHEIDPNFVEGEKNWLRKNGGVKLSIHSYVAQTKDRSEDDFEIISSALKEFNDDEQAKR